MQELNLTVGQKCWSIQLGDCEVIEVLKEEYCYVVKGENSVRYSFDKFGRYSNRHVNPSLFESNPFEPKLEKENKDSCIEPKENKAEMINALMNIWNYPIIKESTKKIAETKLQKILESI